MIFTLEETDMDFLKDDVRRLYQQFLVPSVGSALVISVYSSVDTIAVGQAEGELGTAAMAVVAPLYSFFIFLAILCGVGGSVLMSNAKGKGEEEKGNAYYTASLLMMGILTAVFWGILLIFHRQIFTFFGADEIIMPKALEYARWVIWFTPIFIAPTFLSSFIRNDGAPGLTMAAVIFGGGVNVFGDWFLVFPMGMGMKGAAIATVIGTSVQAIVMCSHFFRKKCGLKLVMPHQLHQGIRKIIDIGFGASVLDLGTVTIAIFMNNQILRYGGTMELGIYGAVSSITSLFQALFSGVGQAIQPLVSANHGAGNHTRVRAFWRYGLITSLTMGVAFTLLGELFPRQITQLFINATPEALDAAPGIFRRFFLLFLFLGVTVLATYYLQSILHGKMSMIIALLRSVFVSGLLILLLPMVMDINGVWLALPASELLTTGIALYYIYKKTYNTRSV